MDRRTGLPIVGMVGAGQLARMTHQAATGLGQSLRILAVDPDESAALVGADVMIGSHASYDDLVRFATGCDVVTWDHEQVSGEHIRRLAAEGHTVLPGADALLFAQDKQRMRARIEELGIGVPEWAAVSTVDDVESFAEKHGWPVVLKVVSGGYDGRGVFVVSDVKTAQPIVRQGIPLLAERFTAMSSELAAVVARSPYGQLAVWPVVETVQRNGICVEVLAPAPGLDDGTALAAQQAAIRLAIELGVVGVLAVELFRTEDGLLVNELAMRPHNSAHWTIEGSRTSQFEQHLRAVLDYPLGDTRMTAPAVAMANVLGGPPEGPGIDERLHHLMARWPAAKVHLYGKQVRPGRKVGHVTVLGEAIGEVRATASAAAGYLAGTDPS
ncbi:MAG: 5-(carboxyamino)imidazole ribonucleotide synthase [Geodermatophilaceae bacterium]|jgi:5-(carboxyamino)imidazole ribonucleotide synthase|nr:5-(carboxyamino)imidazole ribonucleotide synthase [Geodermatophilaceae bacterium]